MMISKKECHSQRNISRDKFGLKKTEAKEMVEAFFEEIRASLEKGESVKLSGFGNFELRSKTERPGRNPKTGEEIPIKARRVVTFHSSQKLKSNVEESNSSLNWNLFTCFWISTWSFCFCSQFKITKT